MALLAAHGCLCQCTFGAAPCPLTVPPANRVLCGGMPAANVMDHIPMVNLAGFGLCSCPTNPTVASATAAALGVLTPMPCAPALPGPWIPPGPTVLIGNMPALANNATLVCAWGGMIKISTASQFACTIPG